MSGVSGVSGVSPERRPVSTSPTVGSGSVTPRTTRWPRTGGGALRPLRRPHLSPSRPGATRRVSPTSLAVLVVTLLVTAVGTIGAFMAYEDAEDRLLADRTAAAGAVLSSAIAVVQTPLASATELMESSGDPSVAGQFLDDAVVQEQLFVGAAVFAVDDAASDAPAAPVVAVGQPLALLDGDAAETAARVEAMIVRTLAADGLSVHDVLDGGRVGYSWSTTTGEAHYVTYAEGALPADRTAVPRPPGPYDDLDFALYLGSTPTVDGFLYGSTDDLPLGGRHASTVVDFGDTDLVLEMRSTTPMSGRLSQTLPWLIGAVGVLLACALAVLVERVLRGRDRAQSLVDEVGALYAEQRRIADTLQRSLLPPSLPEPPGLEVVSGYWPASDGLSVGGDFYDVFAIDDRRWGVVIGDVCGKGVDAAALTALTRHTIRAAARHLTSPSGVLRWAHEAIDAAHHGATYATACMGVLTTPGPDVPGGAVRLQLSLGGHEHPVVCRADGRVEALGTYGSLLGVVVPDLRDTDEVLWPGDRLVLFTDGVTDAPGTGAITLDALIASLTALGPADPDAIVEHIRSLVESRRPDGVGDDTAIVVVGVRATTLEPDGADGMEGPVWSGV